MVLKTTENAIIGVNDHTLVTESDGRRWVTREPAIVYFHKKYWFNIIAMIRNNGISYYCNMASPYYLDEEALKYIDYDLDVKIFTDGEKRLLDVEEYDIYRQCYCGCVYAAQAQNIDLVQVKKDATAFLLDKDVEKDYSHIKFTVTKLDI